MIEVSEQVKKNPNDIVGNENKLCFFLPLIINTEVKVTPCRENNNETMAESKRRQNKCPA